ncbi:unnamed protein product [Candida verbasci]|uniref:Protein kinase domain-containing protein n=1 Tax=Candida verbasci TaxID=1227364 RepID=A0A9W4U142_9ASCO|nr:unnamed protein product [Candida verbasci]
MNSINNNNNNNYITSKNIKDVNRRSISYEYQRIKPPLPISISTTSSSSSTNTTINSRNNSKDNLTLQQPRVTSDSIMYNNSISKDDFKFVSPVIESPTQSLNSNAVNSIISNYNYSKSSVDLQKTQSSSQQQQQQQPPAPPPIDYSHNRQNSESSTVSGSSIEQQNKDKRFVRYAMGSNNHSSKWNINNVLKWLDKHNFNNSWKETFRRNEISGNRFLELENFEKDSIIWQQFSKYLDCNDALNSIDRFIELLRNEDKDKEPKEETRRHHKSTSSISSSEVSPSFFKKHKDQMKNEYRKSGILNTIRKYGGDKIKSKGNRNSALEIPSFEPLELQPQQIQQSPISPTFSIESLSIDEKYLPKQQGNDQMILVTKENRTFTPIKVDFSNIKSSIINQLGLIEIGTITFHLTDFNSKEGEALPDEILFKLVKQGIKLLVKQELRSPQGTNISTTSSDSKSFDEGSQKTYPATPQYLLQNKNDPKVDYWNFKELSRINEKKNLPLRDSKPFPLKLPNKEKPPLQVKPSFRVLRKNEIDFDERRRKSSNENHPTLINNIYSSSVSDLKKSPISASTIINDTKKSLKAKRAAPPPPIKRKETEDEFFMKRTITPRIEQDEYFMKPASSTPKFEEDEFFMKPMKSVKMNVRPPIEEVYNNLEKYFPHTDLDQPIIDDSKISRTFSNANEYTPVKRMKTIRGVANEAKRKVSLSRSNTTKMWGQKVTEVTSIDRFISKTCNKTGNFQEFAWIKGELIGRGSFGEVYLGFNVTTGEMLAVKQCKYNSIGLDVLIKEVETMKDLDHLNIVQYLGYQQTKTTYSLFLEYVAGGSIASCLLSYGKFDSELIQYLTKQVLKGLNYLHKNNIIHRDLKADNLLLELDGICKIGDFGISKKTINVDGPYQNENGSIQGTIFWMAPEVIQNQDGYSAKIDIWSLGCVVLEMFNGKRPWDNTGAMQAIYNIGRMKSHPPINPEIEECAKNFIKKCFTLDPNYRPTAAELLEDEFMKPKNEFNFNLHPLYKIINKS